MSRRKSAIAREKQKSKNKNHIPPKQVSSKLMLKQQALEKHRLKQKKMFAQKYADILVSVSQEYYDGEVKYCSLKAVSVGRGNQMQEEVEKAIKPFAQIPKKEQTQQIFAEVADIIQAKNQTWIEQGWLVAENVKVDELPTGRVYDDGTIESVNRFRDMDIIDIQKRLKEK